MNRREMLLNPNGFELERLAEAISQSIVTYEELCESGLLRNKRAPLQNMIIQPAWDACVTTGTIEAYKQFIAKYPDSEYAQQARSRVNDIIEQSREEEEYWRTVTVENTIQAYNLHLNKFPNGLHANEARFKIDLLAEEVREKKQQLLDEMRYSPHRFPAFRVKDLLNGTDEWYKGVQITDMELVDNELITLSALNALINGSVFEMPQLTIDKLPPLPLNRSDIYFFGVPSSGKSCVLSGFLSAANKEALIKYEHQRMEDGTDPCRAYYDGLINSLEHSQVPQLTEGETCNFMSLKLRNSGENSSGYNPISIIELGGEYFKNATDNITSGSHKSYLHEHGVTKYLSNDNRKMIFFVIDFSKVVQDNYDPHSSDTIQRQTLSRALDVFSHDGTGKDGTVNCTFSKTDSIIVIVTKADLMGVESREERLTIAKQYLTEVYKSFMIDLQEVCANHNINATVGNKPLVTTFSLGRFMLGNTVDFNDRDSIELINIIRNNTRTQRNGSSLRSLIKNILSISE